MQNYYIADEVGYAELCSALWRRRNLRQINARNLMLKRAFSGLQICRWQSLTIGLSSFV